jgi:hypothetical protein
MAGELKFPWRVLWIAGTLRELAEESLRCRRIAIHLAGSEEAMTAKRPSARRAFVRPLVRWLLGAAVAYTFLHWLLVSTSAVFQPA